MKPQFIPLIDIFGAALFIALFLVLLWLQARRPLRKASSPLFRRLKRNLLFSVPGFALVRLAMIPVPLAVAAWCEEAGIGLFHWLPVPPWLAAALTFVGLDWAYYWWHRLNHVVPLFWRFHHVHHTDLDLDVSTAARFHLGEILLSVPFRAVVALLLGPPVLALLIYELCFEVATLFHHSNSRLPLGVERALNKVVVTPRMHGIHHSIVKRETDSNWSTVFCWWDVLHGTIRRDIPQHEIIIGMPAFREELTVKKLLLLPFQRLRAWKLPNGEVPHRDSKPARELEP